MIRKDIKVDELIRAKRGFKPEEKDLPTTIDADGTRTAEAKLKSAKIVAAKRRRAKREEIYNDKQTEFREGNLYYIADIKMRQLRRERKQPRERV